jgi:hypothetical protein
MLSHTGRDQGRRVRRGGGGWLNSDPWAYKAQRRGWVDRLDDRRSTLDILRDKRMPRAVCGRGVVAAASASALASVKKSRTWRWPRLPSSLSVVVGIIHPR